ncbi:MAG: hypothetical protein QGH15_07720 [Kiritimatiellia bacterium]|nr:hypothetical protein [Kiritimatiellia bacterium]
MNRRLMRIASFLALISVLLLAPSFLRVVAEEPADPPKPAIQLGAPFCDNAVLQRETNVPVWGWSKPGTKITVEFGGQKKKATAGKDGKWMLELDKLKASFEPAEMIIADSTGKKVVLKNILVGEVWMASGQSNMQWKVTKSSCNKLKVEPVGAGKVAPIREFEVTSVFAMLHPIEKATGAWKNGSYTDYSAIAFAFAHRLYEELKVPIGILNCSFSQTAIQAWVPRVGFRDGEDEYTKAIYQKVLQTDPTTPEHKTAWDAFYKSLEDQIVENDALIKKGENPKEISAKTPGNMSGNRDATWLFHGRLNSVIPYAIRGGIWNQGYANMGEGLPYYNNLHSMIRGWRLVWDKPELPVYFHQFYSAAMRHAGKEVNTPSIGATAEMRLGTWMARDIPNSGMASQIDVSGGIHYSSKAVPGQRLALHALKNQYGRKLVADGPMFKSYKVKGNKLIIDFEHAKGGLVVAETGYNAIARKEDSTGFADPKIIEKGDDQVKLFYLAGEDRVWHPAGMKIDGDKVVVTSPEVKKPRGVSYATAGVGFQPNLYNKALLPMTPFIYFDHKMVTSETWPDEKLKIAGEVIDPGTVGKVYEWRKMPILSVQFRDNAVFQADKPVTIWGSTQQYGEWGGAAEGEAEISFSFAGIEKTIPVTPGVDGWKVEVPAMKASADPKTMKVSFTIDGELAHERVATNIVYGDVWYVGAPAGKFTVPKVESSGQIVRVIENQSKRSGNRSPSRYSVCVSRTPKNRFASYWKDASGLAGAIGHSIAAKTERPVGVIFMQSKASKDVANPALKTWIAPAFLDQAPSLKEDYKTIGSLYPGNPYYNANIRNYIADWKTYWGEYIPAMIATKAVPDGVTWGTYPSLTATAGDSKATHTYNVYVRPFTPAALSGVVFLSSEAMVAADKGASFGPEMAALGNCLKAKFGCSDDTPFIYTIPDKALAPKVTKPGKIRGKSAGVEITDWSEITKVIEAAVK